MQSRKASLSKQYIDNCQDEKFFYSFDLRFVSCFFVVKLLGLIESTIKCVAHERLHCQLTNKLQFHLFRFVFAWRRARTLRGIFYSGGSKLSLSAAAALLMAKNLFPRRVVRFPLWTFDKF